MRIPAFDDRRALEDQKLAVMRAMSDAWTAKGVVSIDLSTGRVKTTPPEKRKAEP